MYIRASRLQRCKLDVVNSVLPQEKIIEEDLAFTLISRLGGV